MSEAEKMPYFIDSVIFADTGMDFPKISEAALWTMMQSNPRQT